MSFFKLHPKTLTASLLVAGTCIGGGILALPVVAAKTGFIPTITCMVFIWGIMVITALCLIKIGFWMEKGNAHIMTMAQTILGNQGKWLVGALFLFISYASLTAYLAGISHLVSETLVTYNILQISMPIVCFFVTLLFGPFLVSPRAILGKVNDFFFFLMLAAYVVLIIQGIGHIKSSLLLKHDWATLPFAIPLLITAFSFQTMVPSLHPFLNHDKKSLYVSIIFGTFIAFIIYSLWQIVIFGGVPLEGQFGLLYALERGIPATFSLSKLVQSELVARTADLFALFALLTSFFGIGMGLVDFLADGLCIKSKGKGAVLLGLLVLIPSFYFAISSEKVFITALDVSGGFGDTILNGIIPIVMLLVGYHHFAPKLLTKKWHHIGYYILICLFAMAFVFEALIRI